MVSVRKRVIISTIALFAASSPHDEMGSIAKTIELVSNYIDEKANEHGQVIAIAEIDKVINKRYSTLGVESLGAF